MNAETEWRNTQLELISFDGKIIYTEAIPKIAANNPFTKTLNVASVAKGIYLLKMTADNHSAVQKIIID
ncbi:MAG: T9SS type A sorting domain-containing protein [Bacteroidetes bacterium]|nr:T9SS type A sorting domain-containing protein [Bacteroidota bacterium]